VRNVNWLVLEKHDKGTLVGFAELLWVDGTLYQRVGKPMTFGTSTETTHPGAVALVDAVAAGRAALEADGYRTARQWHFDSEVFDYPVLQKEIEYATRRAVARLRQDHPRLNAFALVTDDAAMTIALAAHAFPTLDAAPDDVLFNPGEW
jgi:hypothetical protein